MKQAVYEACRELLLRAATSLPRDVEAAITKAHAAEKNRIAKAQLGAILENIKLAREHRIPLCQDTGLQVFYVSIGDGSCAGCAGIRDEITKAVADATAEIPLRPNVVHPLTRKNTGNNTGLGMPQIEYSPAQGNAVEITVKLAGGGCENMSALHMLNPSCGEREIIARVLEFAKNAGGKPCPPYVLGVAIGGTADRAMSEAKLQAIRKISGSSPLEKKLLQAVNSTGIGTMGLGGRTTALAVHAKVIGTHTASLPLAIAASCWATRHASAKIEGSKIEYL